MAESTLSVDFEALTRAIEMVAGWKPPGTNMANWDATQTQRANDILDIALNMVYTPPPLQPGGRSHRWTWLYPVARLYTVAPYSTGTVVIASGVVTLSDGTFPAWVADGVLIHEGTTYTIDTLDNSPTNTIITLDDTSVTDATSRAYVLARPAYDLPDDFGDMDGPFTYQPGTGLYRPIPIVSLRQIQSARQLYDGTSYPVRAALAPKAFDAGTGQRWEVRFEPLADAVYELWYEYHVIPGDLATTKYPMGGQPHAELFRSAVKAATDLALFDREGVHLAQFMRQLAASITHDNRHAPNTLGVEQGQTYSGDGGGRRIVDDGLVRYNGLPV